MAAPANVAPAAGVPAMGSINAAPLSQAQVRAILDEQEENFTIDQVLAIKQYISQNPTSNGYSMAQNLNYKLDHGGAMNANERYMDSQLTEAMHAIGTDTELWRGAHTSVISALGLTPQMVATMDDAQLNAALRGASWTSKSYTSTSYDRSKSPFISGSQSGGREVIMHISAAGQTNGIFANRAQAEVILGKGTNFRITGASYTGRTAHPRVGQPSRQIQIEVEAW